MMFRTAEYKPTEMIMMTEYEYVTQISISDLNRMYREGWECSDSVLNGKPIKVFHR
jgi:hypothetical protein